jgi:N-acetylglucosamine kinase-like BadF-type ATPase
MILISDSGSTKADWIAVSEGIITGEYSTKGFNPFFHDKTFICAELENNEGLASISDKVSAVYFFGAGCSSPDRNAIISEGLRLFFVNAIVSVEHDMLGCALSVCNGEPGLACIIGTGSNICFFDGRYVGGTRHGLGYVLGDEASGSYFGKKLLAWFVYGLLPAHLDTSFREKYQLSKEDIIRKVYSEPNPNVFLASFATFLSDHGADPFIRNLIRKGMEEFFETNVMAYNESKQYPVHFAGSIAHFFSDVIRDVAQSKNILVGNIIRKPISGLADYFIRGGKIPD